MQLPTMLKVSTPRAPRYVVALVFLALGLAAGCAKKDLPVARPQPTPPPSGVAERRPPAPPEPVAEPAVIPPEPVSTDSIEGRSIEDLNRNSPFQPVFFEYDSSEISPTGRTALESNAQLLKKYMPWRVTIEGHCDERGTGEYNLALGERRAVAARNYLVSIGIPADRLGTVSYGNEFPFDPAHSEMAWSKNRRAHFVITGK